MKRIIFCVLIIAMASFSCRLGHEPSGEIGDGSTDGPGLNNQNDDQENPINTDPNTIENFFDDNGSLVKREVYSPEGELLYYDQYLYDENGSNTFISTFSATDEHQSSKGFRWTEDNKVSLKASYNSTKDLTAYIYYIYDESGKIIEQYSYGSDFQLQFFDIYQYQSGVLSYEGHYNAEGSLEYALLSDYENGLLSKQSVYSNGGELQSYTEYEYDDQDRILKETKFNAVLNPIQIPEQEEEEETALPATRAAELVLPALPKTTPEYTVPVFSSTNTGTVSSYKQWVYTDQYSVCTEFTGSGRIMSRDLSVEGYSAVYSDVFQYDVTDKLTSKTTSYGSQILNQNEYQYDNLGRLELVEASDLIAETNYNYEITYNDDDNATDSPVSRVDILEGTNLLQSYRYELKEDQTTAINCYNGDETLVGSYTYEYNYDNEGNIRVTGADGQGNLQQYFLIFLDNQGNLNKLQYLNASAEEIWTYDFEYNEEGKRILEVHTNAEGEILLSSAFEFEILLQY